MQQSVSAVIPVYNDAQSLRETCEGIIDVHAKCFHDLGLEIIFVNDGSTDDSLSVLRTLHVEYPHMVAVLNLSRTFGKQAAMMAGIRHARGDAVVCLAADLRDPIDLMARMISYWKAGTEAVVCYREGRSEAQAFRSDMPSRGTDCLLMSKQVCSLVSTLKGRSIAVNAAVLSLDCSKVLIPYTRLACKYEKSGYTTGKKLQIAIDILLESAYLSCRFISAIGGLMAFSGVIFSLMIAYAWFVNRIPFSGIAPLVMVLMIIGGVIMLMLGVIAELLWRMYDGGRALPRDFVDRDISPNERWPGRLIDLQHHRKTTR
jgi:polyisoprenyl-phosphate glycosyltransferase